MKSYIYKKSHYLIQHTIPGIFTLLIGLYCLIRQVMTGLYAQMQINNPRTQFIRQTRTYSPVSSGSSGGGHSGGGGGGGGHSGGGGGHSI